jgi:uncharacterized membrane protein
MTNLNRRYLITVIVGTLILLAGIFLAAFTEYSEKITQSGIITIGMVMIVVGVVRMIRKREGPAKDELTRKIADRSAAYSWLATLLVLFVVYWLNFFEVFTFTVNGVIAITYVVMVFTMILCQRIFWRKGDVR